MALRIRAECRADHDAIRAAHRSAFDGDAEVRLVDALRQTGVAVISLVAERDNRVVGHVLFSALEAPIRALALAPVGVVPACRNSGIGSALIREGLKRATEGGWEAVFVLGAPAYYVRFGFSVDAAKNYACPYAGEHFMMRTLGDSMVAREGQLVYPPPFADLD
ncbi:MAG TPA: N-acetyltransferase [Alphaproteobacteria bacterium]|nr:N-acetyltransferase [Alphaproteobacteria bacterium]